jgi:hypothetical protein
VSAAERDRIVTRLAELESVLRQTQSDDVRAMLESTLAELEQRLVQSTARLDRAAGTPGHLHTAEATS